MTAPSDPRPREALHEELRWRAYLVLAQLMHCRAVARLSVAEREDLEIHGGLSLADAAETGRALVGLTPTEVMALADRIEHPWDHAAIRRAVETFGTKAPPASSLGSSAPPSSAERATS